MPVRDAVRRADADVQAVDVDAVDGIENGRNDACGLDVGGSGGDEVIGEEPGGQALEVPSETRRIAGIPDAGVDDLGHGGSIACPRGLGSKRPIGSEHDGSGDSVPPSIKASCPPQREDSEGRSA